MSAVLITLLLCGTALACAYAAYALADRWLALHEREATRLATVPETVRIPYDLQLWMDQQSEPWAKEQTRALLREAYEELGDWARVRTKLGVGVSA